MVFFQYIPIFVPSLNINALLLGIILLPFSFIACKYSNNFSSSLSAFLLYSLISTSHCSLYCIINGFPFFVIILYILSFLWPQYFPFCVLSLNSSKLLWGIILLSISFIDCKYSNNFSSSLSVFLLYFLIITSHCSLYCATNWLPSSVIILYILFFWLFQYWAIFVPSLNSSKLLWGIILLPCSFIACKYSNNFSFSDIFLSWVFWYLIYSFFSTSHCSLYFTINGLSASIIIIYILSFLLLQ